MCRALWRLPVGQPQPLLPCCCPHRKSWLKPWLVSSPLLPAFLCGVTLKGYFSFYSCVGSNSWQTWLTVLGGLLRVTHSDSLRRPQKWPCHSHVYSQSFTHCDWGIVPLVLLYPLETGIFCFNNFYYSFLTWFYLNKLKVGERGEYGSHWGMAVDVTDIDKNRSTEMNQPPI